MKKGKKKTQKMVTTTQERREMHDETLHKKEQNEDFVFGTKKPPNVSAYYIESFFFSPMPSEQVSMTLSVTSAWIFGSKERNDRMSSSRKRKPPLASGRETHFFFLPGKRKEKLIKIPAKMFGEIVFRERIKQGLLA